MARRLPRQRLARRGVMLSALLCGTALARATAAAVVPSALAAATVAASRAFVAGPRAVASTGAVELAEAALRAMAVSRLKVGAVILLVLTVAGAGASLAVRQPMTERNSNISPPPRRALPEAAPDGQPARAAERRMTVTGRVLGRDGQPPEGAQIAVVAGEFRRAGEQGPQAQPGKRVLLSGRADAQGLFHFSLEGPFALRNYGVSLLAAAPGYGPSWYTLSPSEGLNEVECRLDPGRVVRGRLLDAQGVPARGVRVYVAGLVKRGTAAPVLRFSRPPKGLSPWPAPVTTDDAGQFLIRDVGPGCDLNLQVLDERFAPQWLVLKTGPNEATEPVTFALEPRRTLEGTVTCEDTGEPMPNARLFVLSSGPGASPLVGKADGRADSQGRFRLAPFPGQELVVSAHPADGKPYLVLQQSVHWPTATSRHEVHFALPRGVRVRGRVVEVPSGRPVQGATVEYEPRTEDNPYARMTAGAPVIDWWSRDACSGPDGTFELPVLPGPGWLLVKGPSPEYMHVEVSARQLQAGRAGGTSYFPDALVPLDLKADAADREVVATLRRGLTVTGRVLGHDGRPAAAAFLLAPTYLPLESALRGNLLPMRLPVRDGRFELPGCDPDKGVPVLFFDPHHQAGAVVELSGKQAGDEPVLVRLAPCSRATARCVDAKGRLVPQPALRLAVLLRPGADLQDSINHQVDACLTVPVERLWGSSGISFDAQAGTQTFAGLIPGATYLVQADEGNGMVRKAAFTALPGQCMALPDLVLNRPGGGKP
jgi:protocatechuate 3,4-dioxygenase beta subunit